MCVFHEHFLNINIISEIECTILASCSTLVNSRRINKSSTKQEYVLFLIVCESMYKRLAGCLPRTADLSSEYSVVKGILITMLPFEMGLEGEN